MKGLYASYVGMGNRREERAGCLWIQGVSNSLELNKQLWSECGILPAEKQHVLTENMRNEHRHFINVTPKSHL